MVLLAGLVVVWVLFPLIWVGITSIKPLGTEFRFPVEYWPEEPTLENYSTVLGERFEFHRALINSFLVSGISGLGTMICGILAAYGIARTRFRYGIQSLLLLQISGLIPPIAVIAPTFLLLRTLGLIQTSWAMILPNMAYGIPLATFLIASYFSRIPFSLEDAAFVDGASPGQTLVFIILPLAAPGIISAGILVFLGSWGEFMLANTVTQGLTRIQTAPVRILSLSRAFNLQWTWMAAAIILSLIPVLLLVTVFQKWIVQGLTQGVGKD